MKTTLYQIFDTISSLPLGPIMGMPRPEAAIRIFQELAANKETDLGKYPKDFVLLCLGTQDLESGQITAATPHPIYDGSTYLEQRDQAERIANAKSAPAPAANDNGAADAGADLSEEQLKEEFNNRVIELRRQLLDRRARQP